MTDDTVDEAVNDVTDYESVISELKAEIAILESDDIKPIAKNIKDIDSTLTYLDLSTFDANQLTIFYNSLLRVFKKN